MGVDCVDNKMKRTLEDLIDLYGPAILEDPDRLSQFLEDRYGDYGESFRFTFALRALVKSGWTHNVRISAVKRDFYMDILVRNLGFTASAAKDVLDALNALTFNEPEEEPETGGERSVVAKPGNLKRIAGGIANKPRTIWLRERSLHNGLILILSLFALAVLFFQMSGQRSPVGDELRIAFLTRLSGASSEHGLNQLRAAQLAVEDVNKHGGVRGYRLRVVGLDVPQRSAKANESLRSLLDDDSIIAMISGLGGKADETVSQIADEINVPLILTVPPDLPAEESDKPPLYTFRIAADAGERSRTVAYFAIKELGNKKAAIFYNADSYRAVLENEYTVSWIKHFQGQVVADIGYSKKSGSDFTAAMTAVKESGAEVLILRGCGDKAASVISAARRAGFEGPAVGENYLSALDEEDKLAGSWWLNEVSILDPPIRSVMKEFKSLYNESCPEGDVHGAIMAYDSVLWIANALYNALGYRGEAIRHSLLATKNFPMTQATLTIDPRTHGPYNKAMSVIYCSKGKGIFQRRIRESKVE
jgi:branched-chain amino acid transport system substrate-binding protein